MTVKMAFAQEYYVWIPLRGGILAATSSGFLPEKKLFSGDFIEKNRELYVNLTILAGFFANNQSKIIAATFRNMESTRLDGLYIYEDKSFLLKSIFRKLYLKNLKKC